MSEIKKPNIPKGPWRIDEDPRPGMQWNRSITDASGENDLCFLTTDGSTENLQGLRIAKAISALPETIDSLISLYDIFVSFPQEIKDDINEIHDSVGNEIERAEQALQKAGVEL